MPIVSYSDVQRLRAMLTCAIMMKVTFDVGRVINIEMMAVFDAWNNRAFGFPLLINQLCHRAEVDVTFSDPADRIGLLLIIKEEMYALGEKVKRGQRQAASDDEEDAQEMDNDQGHGREQEKNEEDAQGTEQEDLGHTNIEARLGELSDRLEEIHLAVDARFDQMIAMTQQSLTSHFAVAFVTHMC